MSHSQENMDQGNLPRLPVRLIRRNDVEREFLPAALEIIETPVSPVGRAVGGVIVGACVAALLWASLGKTDIIATANGRIIPVGKVKTVQPFETGVVAAIHVNDGDHVKAGQVLIEMDPVQAQADHDQYAADLVRARLDMARLRGLQAGLNQNQDADTARPALLDPPAAATPEQRAATLNQLLDQYDAQQEKLAALDEGRKEKLGEAAEASAGIDKYQATLPWAQKEADIRNTLMEMHYGNEIAWVEAESQLADQQHEVTVLARHRDQAIASAAEIARQRAETVAEFERDTLDDLNKARNQASELEADLAKAQMRLDLDQLRAPISGTVESLAVHTVGGVVTPAQPLLIVVPDDAPLEVEASVQNRDVGFVHVGQKVELKIEAFAFTRYGMIGGKVIALSRDATVQSRKQNSDVQAAQDNGTDGDSDNQETPAYVADISLDRSAMDTETGRVSLEPGMTVTAEIATGRRSIISYLLSPVEKLTQEAGHER